MTPKDLVSLAKSHVIMPGHPVTTLYGRPQMMSLVPSQDFKGRPTVYALVEGDIGDKAFKTYICDYGAGEVHYQVLGHEADFCFTAKIDGCTFSIGMAASDGTVIVSHTNAMARKLNPIDKEALGYKQGDMDFSRSAQLALARQMHNGQGSFLERSSYWAGGQLHKGRMINVTVFGVRGASGWEFHVQRWLFKPGDKVPKLLDLNKFSKMSESF